MTTPRPPTTPSTKTKAPTKSAKDIGVIFRRGHWWARWTCTAGHDHRWLVAKKTEGKDIHQEKARAVREARRSGEPCCPRLDQARAAAQPQAVQMETVIADYAEHCRRAKRSHATDRSRLREIRAAFGAQLVDQLTPAAIDDWRLTLTADGVRSPTTVNHHVKLLRALINRAIARGTFPGPNPVVRVKLAREPTGRVRYLTEDEEAQLFAELPDHVRPVVAFALVTGLRKQEILGMTWDAVDLATATLHLATSKTGARAVLLSPAAIDLLRQQRTKPLVSRWCFPSPRGRHLTNLDRAWLPAVRAAQIANFRFHDLRHTWASRLAMSGADTYTIQRLGGWAGPAMVQRYAHLTNDHLRAALARLPVPSSGPRTAPLAQASRETFLQSGG